VHGWQTACIIHEVEDEIAIQTTVEYHGLTQLRLLVRTVLQETQLELETERKRQRAIEMAREDVELVDSLDAELKAINQKISAQFNPYFGSVFRTDGNPTLLAFNIRR